MKLLFRWAILALSMWVATLVVPGITVNGGVTTYLWVALLFGLINSIFGSIIKVLTFPVSIVTFGLFVFVINAAMLALTARWSDKLDVTGFWSALFASSSLAQLPPLQNQARSWFSAESFCHCEPRRNPGLATTLANYREYEFTLTGSIYC
jgi:putative membrane protein